MQAYAEIVEFLVSSPSLEAIISFYPSEAVRDRVEYLYQVYDDGTITPDELAELQEYDRVQRFLDKLRLRAQRRLGSSGVGAK